MAPALSGKKVLVHGLGKSGLAAVRLLSHAGARVSVVDSKTEAELGPTAAGLRAQGAELFLGAIPPGLHQRFELVVVSPGVPLSSPELVAAAQAGVRVVGEIELAGWFLQAPVIGITGTNGKSTTTALTGELLARAGKRTFVGGNLGRPLSEAPLTGEEYDALVVELSSFQLEGIRELRVNAAAILNLTPDHLDRYPSHAEYGQAKARIFANQKPGDVAVLNLDDLAVRALAPAANGATLLGFSLQPGALPAEFAGMAYPKPGGFRVEWGGDLSFRVNARSLRGAHNLQNAMAATLLALASGAAPTGIQAGLDAYPGLPHRLESVRILDGVEYVNDSKATNVESSLVALAAFPKGVWLIAGGKGKGAPYRPLVDAAAGRVNGVLTVGADAPLIESAFQGAFPVHACGDLAAAVAKARSLAKEGEVVLLSPACASYDQFKNFEDRGEQFKTLVKGLS